ncbi:MAG: SIMPL domain-containing protein [Candidatus Peribacteraceae bacterium]
MKNIAPLLIAVALGGAFYLLGQTMAPRTPMLVSVSADAKVSASPDIATLSFGVQTGRQPTAEAAVANLKKNIDSIIAAVEKVGIEKKDIGTENFWMNPAYDYVNGRQVERGFEATQSLRVKVRDLEKVGAVLTAATSAGANQAGGVTFAIDNPDELKATARSQAIEKARAKAEVLAKNLGMRIVRLTSFGEDGQNPANPMMMREMNYGGGMGGGGGDASMTIPSGEQDITSYVTLTYELR